MNLILKTIFLTNIILLFLPSENLDFEEFKNLHKQLQQKNEVWKTIPWHLDLKTAQKQAANEKKLLFIWAMDGHPFGCT